jgi:hypothetical protein
VGTSRITHSLASLGFTEQHFPSSELQWRATLPAVFQAATPSANFNYKSPGHRNQPPTSNIKSSSSSSALWKWLPALPQNQRRQHPHTYLNIKCLLILQKTSINTDLHIMSQQHVQDLSSIQYNIPLTPHNEIFHPFNTIYPTSHKVFHKHHIVLIRKLRTHNTESKPTPTPFPPHPPDETQHNMPNISILLIIKSLKTFLTFLK